MRTCDSQSAYCEKSPVATTAIAASNASSSVSNSM